MRKDSSIATSISIQLVDDSIIIKDANGKTRIASVDDDKKIAKIIVEIAKDTNLPDLDIHHIGMTDEGPAPSNGPIPNVDFTDVDSMKKAGIGFLLNHLQNAGNYRRTKPR